MRVTDAGDGDVAKRAAAEAAVALVEDGMALGLGTGSTVRFVLEALGRRVAQGLRVRAVATSRATAALARGVGIALVPLHRAGALDLALDGADEISPALDMIKGGGGALLREKLVALAADRRVIVVDTTKVVDRLGHRPVPVEVVRFGWPATAGRLSAVGAAPALRQADGRPFVTDEGHHILDCDFGPIDRPADLERTVKLIPGVVESGLFVGLCDVVLVGDPARRVERRTPASRAPADTR